MLWTRGSLQKPWIMFVLVTIVLGEKEGIKMVLEGNIQYLCCNYLLLCVIFLYLIFS